MYFLVNNLYWLSYFRKHCKNIFCEEASVSPICIYCEYLEDTLESVFNCIKKHHSRYLSKNIMQYQLGTYENFDQIFTKNNSIKQIFLLPVACII